MFKFSNKTKGQSKWVIPTVFFALILGVVGQNSASASSDYDRLWKEEQAMRGAYNKVLTDERTTREAVLQAKKDALAVLKWTYRPEAEAAVDGVGYKAFVYQRNDITVDLMVASARLNDKEALAAYFDDLIKLLKELPKEPPPPRDIFGTYYQLVSGRGVLKPFLSDQKVKARLNLLASRSLDRRFLALPYETSDTEKISEIDRVMAVSHIYSEAKYNFANWDLVKELDWEEAYREALVQAKKAKDRYAFYNVVREFVGKLSDSHTDVGLPPYLRSKLETGLPIRTLLVGDDLVATDDSPVGIRKGDIIDLIDGIPAKEYGEKRWGRFFRDSTPHYRKIRIYTYMLLRGPRGSKVNLQIRRGGSSSLEITAVRDGKTLLAPVPRSEFKILPDGTAYFAFNTCEDEGVVDDFRKSLPEIQKAGRLVIDIRKNGGGNSSVGWEILRHFLTSTINTTTWETPQYRASLRAWGREQTPYKPTSENKLSPHPNHFGGKVAVLMGAMSFSAAEDFAGAAVGVARLFGSPTGGSTGQPLFFNLPGGGWARICSKRDRLANGKEFVGVGVQPDESVPTTSADWAAGRDPVLEAALTWLRK